MKKPSFELSRVFEDSSTEAPQIVPVTKLPWNTQTGRRGFLGTGIAASTALMLAGTFHAKGNDTVHPTDQSNVPECNNVYAHNGTVHVLAVTPDGKTLISGGEDKAVKVWGLPEGALLRTISSHSGPVYALAVDAAGTIFVSGSDDKTIKVWNLSDKTLVRTLNGHTAGIRALAISPNGKMLVSSASDKTIRIWDLSNGSLVKNIENTFSALSLALSPDGNILATGCDDTTVKLWSLPDLSLIQTLTGHTGNVCAMAYGQDGSIMVSAGMKGKINLWGQPKSKTLEESSGPVYAVAIHTGEQILASTQNQNIRLWNLRDTSEKKTLTGHTSSIRSLTITPDGKTLISGSADKSIKLWNLADESLISCLIDLKCTPSSGKGITVNGVNAMGQQFTYTLPCGSPIPAGATCTCNCVPGSYTVSVPTQRTHCSCDQVCTCVPVYY